MSGDIERYDDDKDKAAFFRELEKMRPDLMFPEAWTDVQKAEAADIVRPTRVKTSLVTTIPQICRGDECVFAESCPLLKQNLAPVGSKCPIEQSLVLQLFYDYIDELKVDVNRAVETSLVRDLVDQDIQQFRKTWLLSQEHFIQENVVGVDSEGNVVTAKELHKAVDYEDRILRRKDKILKQLLATREAKAKAGQGQIDSAQVISGLMGEMRKIENQRQKALKEKLGLAEYDEYIDGDDDIIDAEVVEEGDVPHDSEE